jgi:hypothetical protein
MAGAVACRYTQHLTLATPLILRLSPFCCSSCRWHFHPHNSSLFSPLGGEPGEEDPWGKDTGGGEEGAALSPSIHFSLRKLENAPFRFYSLAQSELSHYIFVSSH